MRPTVVLSVGIGLLLIAAVPVNAQPVPVGSEFRVNTYTTDVQESAVVGATTDGDFVVVWGGVGQGDTLGIFGQRYDSSGAPQGSEFLVNTYTTNVQRRPAVIMTAPGAFTVVWQSLDGSYNIVAQRYDSSGAPQGSEFLVNTYTTGPQLNPSAAADASGNFIVVWNGIGQGDGSGVFAQRYDSSGTPLGSEFQVNTYTTENQGSPAVATGAAGNLVVVWADDGGFVDGQDGSSFGVFGRRYDSSGTPLGSEFQVNTYTTGAQGAQGPAVAADVDGNFVVVWSGAGQGDPNGIFGQRYDSSGAPQGSEFRVNTNTVLTQGYPAVAVDGDGNFLVVWTDVGDAVAQAYDASGTAQGSNVIVNESSGVSELDVAAGMDGDFVVVWRHSDVYGRRLSSTIPSIPTTSPFGQTLLGALLAVAIGLMARRRAAAARNAFSR